MSLKEFVKKHYPHALPFRRIISRVRLRQSYKYSLSDKDIIAGEDDFLIKKRIVEKCSEKWPEVTKDLDEQIRYLRDSIPLYGEKINSETIEIDMKFCYFAYGFTMGEYLYYELENKNIDKRRDYISDVDRMRIGYKTSDIIECDQLTDKWEAYEKFSKYYARSVISVNGEDDYKKFDQFTETYPVFVRKNAILCRGESIELVNLPEVLNQDEITKQEYFDKMISDGRKYVLEEKIEQGEQLSALYPGVANTVRCLTFYTKKEVVLGFCFLRIGRNGSFIDNSSAGGIVVGIDKENGQLNTDGFDKLGMQYGAHPDTGVEFKGYQLPEWNELIQLCQEASMLIPAIKFIGWDCAYSETGWVIIEGNSFPQITGPQIVRGKGLKKEVEDIMSQMELLVP